MTLNLDFDACVTKNGSTFRKEMQCDLASILGVDVSFVHIESVAKGSIIIAFFVIAVKFKYIMMAAAATGLITGGITGYVIKCRRERRRQQLLRSGTFDIPPVVAGDTAIFEYNNEKYEATVLRTIDEAEKHYVEVKYTGSSKPYWIQKKEKLNMRDKRLHFKIEDQTENDSKKYFKFLENAEQEADLQKVVKALAQLQQQR